jgi:hypothetical protein
MLEDRKKDWAVLLAWYTGHGGRKTKEVGEGTAAHGWDGGFIS